MATTTGAGNKPATQSLLDDFEKLIAERSKSMTDDEFKNAETGFKRVIDKVKDRVSRRVKRGTA